MKETAKCDVFIRVIRVIRGLRRFFQPLLGCGRETALSILGPDARPSLAAHNRHSVKPFRREVPGKA